MGRQFVIQLENRPGELAHLARALAARGIDIRHVASVGAGEFASAYVTTTDDDATREVLHGLGHLFIEGATVTMEVPDQPGGLAEITEKLAAAGVNVQGALIVGCCQGFKEMAFAVDDEQRARAALGLEEIVATAG